MILKNISNFLGVIIFLTHTVFIHGLINSIQFYLISKKNIGIVTQVLAFHISKILIKNDQKPQ